MSLFQSEIDKYESGNPSKLHAEYMDRRALSRSKLSEHEFRAKNSNLICNSRTLYIGNLSIWTNECQLWRYFTMYFDGVEDVIMGINRNNNTTAGFCFLVFVSSSAALEAHRILHNHDKHSSFEKIKQVNSPPKYRRVQHEILACGSENLDYDDWTHYLRGDSFSIDERCLRVDFDRGGDIRAEGRYWGRGYSGGQVRDEYRSTIDMARGGANARKFWEAKKCNRFIPSLNQTKFYESGSKVENEQDSDESGENIRPVYNWLSFSVKNWKYKMDGAL